LKVFTLRSSFCYQDVPNQPLSLPGSAPLPIRAWRKLQPATSASLYGHHPNSALGRNASTSHPADLSCIQREEEFHLSDYYPKILVWTKNSCQTVSLSQENGNGLRRGTPGNQELVMKFHLSLDEPANLSILLSFLLRGLFRQISRTTL